MAGYTKLNLKDDVDDQGPNFGYEGKIEARMARVALELEHGDEVGSAKVHARRIHDRPCGWANATAEGNRNRNCIARRSITRCSPSLS